MEVANEVRKRAKRHRHFGLGAMLMAVVVGVALVALFLFSLGKLSVPLYRQMFHSGASPRDESNVPKKPQPEYGSKEYYQELSQEHFRSLLHARVEIDRVQAELNQRYHFVAILSDALVRVGTVLMAIFIIQILTSVGRYHFRVSDHLEAVADTVELSESDAKTIQSLLLLISPRHIEFGTGPKSPFQQVVELSAASSKKTEKASLETRQDA
jgi:hypothetical protein